jgi:heme/copper-type cytochrome/quinol oxidase subunit 4
VVAAAFVDCDLDRLTAVRAAFRNNTHQGDFFMNWIIWLGIAVVITAIAAVTGMKAKGTRPVAHTRMMGMARIALFVIVAIFLYMAYQAKTG